MHDPGRTRTFNLGIKSALLCQLSYGAFWVRRSGLYKVLGQKPKGLRGKWHVASECFHLQPATYHRSMVDKTGQMFYSSPVYTKTGDGL